VPSWTEARIEPRTSVPHTSHSTAYGIQVIWPLDYMGRSGPSSLDPHKKFGCGVFYDPDPHENMTEINLNPHHEQLCEPIKCSKLPGRQGFASDSTGSAYSAPQTPQLVGREHSLPKNPTPLACLAIPALLFSPLGLAISMDPSQCRRWIGAVTRYLKLYLDWVSPAISGQLTAESRYFTMCTKMHLMCH